MHQSLGIHGKNHNSDGGSGVGGDGGGDKSAAGHVECTGLSLARQLFLQKGHSVCESEDGALMYECDARSLNFVSTDDKHTICGLDVDQKFVLKFSTRNAPLEREIYALKTMWPALMVHRLKPCLLTSLGVVMYGYVRINMSKFGYKNVLDLGRKKLLTISDVLIIHGAYMTHLAACVSVNLYPMVSCGNLYYNRDTNSLVSLVEEITVPAKMEASCQKLQGLTLLQKKQLLDDLGSSLLSRLCHLVTVNTPLK